MTQSRWLIHGLSWSHIRRCRWRAYSDQLLWTDNQNSISRPANSNFYLTAWPRCPCWVIGHGLPLFLRAGLIFRIRRLCPVRHMMVERTRPCRLSPWFHFYARPPLYPQWSLTSPPARMMAEYYQFLPQRRFVLGQHGYTACTASDLRLCLPGSRLEVRCFPQLCFSPCRRRPSCWNTRSSAPLLDAVLPAKWHCWWAQPCFLRCRHLDFEPPVFLTLCLFLDHFGPFSTWKGVFSKSA